MVFTGKQQAFIDNYIKTLNATESARRAGYEGDDNSLGVIGHNNLRKVKIRAEIDRRLKEAGITDDEIEYRLVEQARTDISDFVDIHEGLGQFAFINLHKAKAAGKLHLIKKLKQKAGEQVEIEFHDSQAALVHLAKLRGLYKEKSELTVIVRLQQALDSGQITPEQVIERWPNLAEQLFGGMKVNVGSDT